MLVERDSHGNLIPVSSSPPSRDRGGWDLIVGFGQVAKWLFFDEPRRLRAGLTGQRGYRGALASSFVASLALIVLVAWPFAPVLSPMVILPLITGLLAISLLNTARRQSAHNLQAARRLWISQLAIGGLTILLIPTLAVVGQATTGSLTPTQLIGSIVLVIPLCWLLQHQLTRFRQGQKDIGALTLGEVTVDEGEEQDHRAPATKAEPVFQPLQVPTEPAPMAPDAEAVDTPNEDPEEEPEPPEQIEHILAELEETMIGQEGVKKELQQLASRIQINAERRDLGMPVAEPDLNILFLGPAGTFKSSCAKYVARIYYALGLLPSGELMAEDIASFIGKYQGHTEDAVKNLFDRSVGKTLLLDEAYGLITSENDDFGKKALNLIVNRIEAERNERAVIFAGYAKEMEDFFSHNSGLASRFPSTFHFQAYSAEELVEIFVTMISADGYLLTEEASNRLLEIFASIQASGQSGAFGNGRGARNLKNSAIGAQSDRIMGMPTRDIDTHRFLTLDDIEAAYQVYLDNPWNEG